MTSTPYTKAKRRALDLVPVPPPARLGKLRRSMQVRGSRPRAIARTIARVMRPLWESAGFTTSPAEERLRKGNGIVVVSWSRENWHDKDNGMRK